MACRSCWRIPPWAEPYVGVLVLVVALGLPLAMIYSFFGRCEFKVPVDSGVVVLKKGMSLEEVERTMGKEIVTTSTIIRGLRQGMHVFGKSSYQLEFENRKLIGVTAGPERDSEDMEQDDLRPKTLAAATLSAKNDSKP